MKNTQLSVREREHKKKPLLFLLLGIVLIVVKNKYFWREEGKLFVKNEYKYIS